MDIKPKIVQKDNLIDIKTPTLNTSNVCNLYSKTQLFIPIYIKYISTSPFFMILQFSHPFFFNVGLKLKYI